MDTPYLDTIKSAAVAAAKTKFFPKVWGGIRGFFSRPQVTPEIAAAKRRGLLIGGGLGAAAAGGAGLLHAQAQKHKSAREGYEAAMREIGPLVAARHHPQGAMSLRAHQRRF